jgi:alpha-tubulin suppressor-like RCC1 family protein
MSFSINGECITNIFIAEEEFINRYVGQQLWLWGAGAQGAIGNNAIINRSSPVQTVSGGTEWCCASGASSTTSAIKVDGTLWMWGCGLNGQMGNNAATSRSSPVQTVSAGTNWCSVSVGLGHIISLKTDGTLWAWGTNTAGTLGTNNVINRSSPVQTVSGGTTWCRVAAGVSATAAIKTDGTLWTWGCGLSGPLGTGNAINRSSPVQTVSGGTNWRIVVMGVCTRSTAAIKTDGTLWVWGDNTAGTLGTDDSINRSSPVQTISSSTNWRNVSIGNAVSAATKTDGTLWTWGSNSCGQLGTNDIIDRSSPVQTVSGGTNWRCVSMESNGAAIKSDGTLWMWGLNTTGKLGINNTTNLSSPVQTINGGTSWRTITSTGSVTAATCTIEF